MAHDDTTRIARQALRRFRGNVRAVLDDRLPGRIGIREHRRIDVDHDLIAFTRRPWIDSVVQGRLGDECERVRFLLLDRRPVRGTVEISLFRGGVHVSRSGGTVHELGPRGRVH